MAVLNSADVAAVGGVIVLAQGGLAQPVTGTTAKTALATIVILGGTMKANDQIEVEALWSLTNSANSKTMQIEFGGSLCYSVGLTTSASLQGKARVANRNSTSSQVFYPTGSQPGLGGSTGTVTTTTKDTTADVSVVIYGTLANSAETITLESYRVLLLRGV